MQSEGQRFFEKLVDHKHRQQDLAAPFRAVDDQDWEFLLSLIPDGGRGRFWKAVFAELRPLLKQN